MEYLIFFLMIFLPLSIFGKVTQLNYYASSDYIDEINSQDLPWKAGHNFPEDFSFDQMYNMAGSEPRVLSNVTAKSVKSTGEIEGRYQYPDTLDLRQQHKYCSSIGTVHAQGNCRSAWAIAPLSTFTDHVCIKTKGNHSIPFSSYHVLTCCYLCGRGCNGGWDDSAFFFLRRHGAISGGGYKSNTGCQPYAIPPCNSSVTSANDTSGCTSSKFLQTPRCNIKCTNRNYTTTFNKDKFKMKDLGGCENKWQAKSILFKYGPLETNFPVYSDLFHYKSGVYKRSKSAKMIGYHCIKVIGYGKENGLEYWLAVNSWGNNWGIGGLCKIAIDTNGIDFEAKFTYPVLY